MLLLRPVGRGGRDTVRGHSATFPLTVESVSVFCPFCEQKLPEVKRKAFDLRPAPTFRYRHRPW